MAELMDVLRLLRNLKEEEKFAIDDMRQHLSEEEIKEAIRLVKQRKIALKQKRVNIMGKDYFAMSASSDKDEVRDFVSAMNKKIDDSVEKRMFGEFSQDALSRMIPLIAPNIVGFDFVKKAALLQLFALDHLHILLLGDPGTGKTEIIRSASDLHPVSTFGLGSGTSSVGLAVSVKGNEIAKGLLPMADNGLACIDELNLMKKEDMASLYNAMEKGFVSYDKGGHHYKFDARVSVLATANPKGDRFTGKTINDLKSQMPFDSALLTRFHLLFMIHRPDTEQFKEITRSIISGRKSKASDEDISFVKAYIKEAEGLRVSIPKSMEKRIVDFAEELRDDEDKYLVEVSPRLVIGLVRMAKAAARMELRESVEQKDIDLVKGIVRESLKTG